PSRAAISGIVPGGNQKEVFACLCCELCWSSLFADGRARRIIRGHRKPIWPACDLVSTIFILGTPECHPHRHCGNTRKRIWLCCWVAKFATSSMLPGSVSRFIR